MVTDPAWLDWSVKVVVPALAGLAGVAIGAQLTTRRERWNLRRQLYGDLIGELVELESRIHDLENSLGPPPLSDVASRIEHMQSAVITTKRALAVAMIVISPGVAKVIDAEIGPGVSAASPGVKSSTEMLARFRVVLRTAVKDLQRDARADLLGGSGWVPAESWRGDSKKGEG